MIDEKVEQSKASDLREIECDATSQDGSLYLSRGSTHETRMMESTLDGPKVISKLNHPIYRICLTGGPCAGKTTALVSIAQVLSQLGFRVLQVPEAATMLMKGGAMIQTHKLNLKDAV